MQAFKSSCLKCSSLPLLAQEMILCRQRFQRARRRLSDISGSHVANDASTAVADSATMSPTSREMLELRAQVERLHAQLERVLAAVAPK